MTARLMLALALVLLGFGLLAAGVARSVATHQEQEALQRLSHGLARHIVEHWPEITAADRDLADRQAREALLAMLMVVNPGVQVYLLDADGRVTHYLGEPGMVRTPQVDLDAVRRFLGGATLPLLGTDPMGGSQGRLFSAAMFAPRPGDARPPGYLYVVLDGAARTRGAGALGDGRAWLGTAAVAFAGLLASLALGAYAFRRITAPLRHLAQRMQAYRPSDAPVGRQIVPGAPARDEVKAIADAFDALTLRLEANAAREQQQAQAHRETMAGVAHDLRTPLTALHGHLEALAGLATVDATVRARLLQAALAQSDKVRRLSQQLFELAALQSTTQVLHRERFRLDELVSDAVQKFELASDEPAVTLAGPPPGSVELDGDLHLIERALTNLIDNALRHAGAAGPVRVSLQADTAMAQILVEDTGPGLPADLQQRLAQGVSLREPPLHRASGSLGGLGLAIVQRVALLHGGSLRALPAPQGGTRLCLALPMGR